MEEITIKDETNEGSKQTFSHRYILVNPDCAWKGCCDSEVFPHILTFDEVKDELADMMAMGFDVSGTEVYELDSLHRINVTLSHVITLSV